MCVVYVCIYSYMYVNIQILSAKKTDMKAILKSFLKVKKKAYPNYTNH